MKVSCQACGAKYTIADDKVRGRKVKIRCKSCGAPIVVDAQSEAPPAGDAQQAPAEAPGAPLAAAPAAAAKSEAWSVNLSDTDQRNMTTDEIVAGWKAGVVTNDAFVWKDGMNDWIAILECEELRGLLSSPAGEADPSATPFGPTIVTAPIAASTASKGLPAARVSGGRARGGVDLFDAVEGGGEDEVATSAPAFPGMAGTQPYDDGKLTGARNENSVLFSLDALKGGLTAEPARKAPPPARAVASDPLVASPASVLGGGASPLFSLSADQALLTAPAPPDPPPRSVEAADGRGGRPQNKLMLYGGGGAVVVALLGVGVLLGRSGKEEAPKDAGKETAAAVSAGAEKTAKKEEEEKKEEAKAEAKPEASASAAPSASAPEKKPSLAATGRKEAPAATSPTATGAPTTKKEEPAPAAGTAPFSVSAAQVALTQAASNSAGCKKPDGPTGSGKVQVTFATSGRVTSATVTGPPFAGTPVGGCVAGIFRKAKIPPYAGTSVTVSKSFSIK